MSNCQRSRQLAQAYLDGALEGPEREVFEGHVRACPACRQVLWRYKRLFSALAAPAIPEPRPDLAERTMALVSAAARRRRAAQTAVGAAALVVCGAVASVVWGLADAVVEAVSGADVARGAMAAAASLLALGETLGGAFDQLASSVSLPWWFGFGVLGAVVLELALLARWRRVAASAHGEQSRVTR